MQFLTNLQTPAIDDLEVHFRGKLKFYPSSSFDQFLFDKKTGKSLNDYAMTIYSANGLEGETEEEIFDEFIHHEAFEASREAYKRIVKSDSLVFRSDKCGRDIPLKAHVREVDGRMLLDVSLHPRAFSTNKDRLMVPLRQIPRGTRSPTPVYGNWIKCIMSSIGYPTKEHPTSPPIQLSPSHDLDDYFISHGNHSEAVDAFEHLSLGLLEELVSFSDHEEL